MTNFNKIVNNVKTNNKQLLNSDSIKIDFNPKMNTANTNVFNKYVETKKSDDDDADFEAFYEDYMSVYSIWKQVKDQENIT